jgi:nicotinamide riboside kinase
MQEKNNPSPIFQWVLTGPESSGKSTLAEALSAALHAPCVPEFARVYLQGLGRDYFPAEVDRMERGQYAWEQWYGAGGNMPLVLDTDWTVYYVWRKYTLKQDPVLLVEAPQTQHKFYFLCRPDFPWQPDPLREHPQEQLPLFEEYVALLESRGLPYAVLEGSVAQRIEKALGIIRQM